METSPVNKEKQHIADKFDRLAEAWAKSCMKAVPLAGLLEVLEPIVPDFKEEIKSLHVQGQQYLTDEFKTYVKSIIDSHDFARKQDKLQLLIEEASQREPVECQLLPSPAQVTEGALNKAKLLEIERLQNTLDDLTVQNAELKKLIRQEERTKQEKEKKLLKRITLYTELSQLVNSIPAEDYFQLQKNLK
ncbi:hypothetical protein EDC96DRAFT_575529 [Choanephora cucurbitarum]|nr:hypothetical protein EDC96DRAFT_575529 [Choanephora cucurbitarum]